MGLKCQHQAPPRKCTTCCRQRGRHFDRVVAVVINHGEDATVSGLYIAIALEAPANALELRQGFLDGGVRHIELHSDGNR